MFFLLLYCSSAIYIKQYFLCTEAVCSSLLSAGQKYPKKAQVKVNTVRKYNKGMGCGSPSQTLSHTLSFQLNREVEAVGLFLEFWEEKEPQVYDTLVFLKYIFFYFVDKTLKFKQFQVFPSLFTLCIQRDPLNHTKLFLLYLPLIFLLHQRKTNEMWYSLSLLRSGICFFGWKKY